MFIVLSAIGLLLAGTALVLMCVSRLFGRVMKFAFGFVSAMMIGVATLLVILASLLGICCALVGSIMSIVPICLVMMLIICGVYAILNRSK